jgi:hypothetical protein
MILAPLGVYSQPTVVSFAGYEWIVKDSRQRQQAPGPNFYSASESNVLVDDEGYLHLRIDRHEDKWRCAEVFTRKRFGYGTYRIEISGNLADLDPSMVLGLFTYDTADPPVYQEIDIEFTRWSVPDGPPGHYTVQPYQEPGNGVSFDLDGGIDKTVHLIHWMPESIVFESFAVPEKTDDSSLIQRWTYDQTDIPHPSKPAFRMNLWLFRGTSPANPGEIIVRDFQFDPMP